MRAPEDLDALNPARAGVVSDIQIGLHLDHLVSPDFPDRPSWRMGPGVSFLTEGPNRPR
jgi:hypothetical protein